LVCRNNSRQQNNPTVRLPVLTPAADGIFFILFFAAILKILPLGGMVGAPPPSNKIEYALDVLNYLILPAGAFGAPFS
jgi:ABC-type dipeptide/oligopeptide/nickel transport system permease component